MTIIRCPKCSYTVSDRAPACPKCKLPLRDALKPRSDATDAMVGAPPAPLGAPAAAKSATPTASATTSAKVPWWKAGSTKSLFGRLESRADAITMIQGVSTAVLIIAAIQGLVGLFVDPGLLFDAVVYGILGGVLKKHHSRVAAVLLLMVAMGTTVVTFGNKIGASSSGGKNVMLALLVTLAAARAVEAAFKLQGRFREEISDVSDDAHVPIIVRGRLRSDTAQGTESA